MEQPNLETRWIVLGTDGQHDTLARHSEPTHEEAAVAAADGRAEARHMAGAGAALTEGGSKGRLSHPCCQCKG